MTARSLFTFFGTILLTAACGGSQSTVTVPPRQEFLLGEGEPGAFTATLRNVGDVEIVVEGRDGDGSRVSSFGFPAGGETTITVGEGQVAVFVNPNDQPAVIDASLSQNVQGMRYEPTEAEAGSAVVDAAALGALVVGDWSGTLTYIDYSSGAETEIAAALEVRQVGPAAFSAVYLYPDEPQANDSVVIEIADGGRTFGERPVISAEEEDDGYVIRTSEQGVDGGEEVVRFFTYRISPSELTIRTDYQTLGSTETRFRNEYRFTR